MIKNNFRSILKDESNVNVLNYINRMLGKHIKV